MKGNILLIGVGNEFRNDDGVGLLVAREIKRRHPEGVVVVEACGEGVSLMQAWSGAERVIIIDAISSGEPPGSLHRIDVSMVRVPRGLFHYSSHAFGVAEAIEMARELHELPASVLVYGIEGQAFDAGIGLSDPVVRNIPSLIHMIEEDLRAMRSS